MGEDVAPGWIPELLKGGEKIHGDHGGEALAVSRNLQH